MTECEAIGVVWNAVTNSSLAVRSSNTKENLQRFGWSLELQDYIDPVRTAQ
jgi:hypothetical protein